MYIFFVNQYMGFYGLYTKYVVILQLTKEEYQPKILVKRVYGVCVCIDS